ncbi:MAG TPA: ferritin-like domain-containing protein [Flavipsychrobacter sp.]|nr:ferritin-like domain-containing protein [Flavipsychrobacter sp.]
MKKSRSQSSSGRSNSSKSNAGGNRKSASTTSRSTSSSSRSSGSKSAGASSRSTGGSRSGSGSAASKSTARSSSKPTSSSRSSSTVRSAAKPRGRSKQTTPREDLQEVLKDGLKDIYYAEKQLVKALKKMSKAATNEELREAFDTHRTQTEEQVQLLEQAFEAMEMRAAGKKCPAMDGLIEESQEHIEEMDKGPALDAALIMGAQKVEHYEIAAYGSMRAFSKVLGLTECEQIFDQILQQESETDELLTQIAATVNQEALSGEEDEESEVEMEEQEM